MDTSKADDQDGGLGQVWRLRPAIDRIRDEISDPLARNSVVDGGEVTFARFERLAAAKNTLNWEQAAQASRSFSEPRRSRWRATPIVDASGRPPTCRMRPRCTGGSDGGREATATDPCPTSNGHGQGR